MSRVARDSVIVTFLNGLALVAGLLLYPVIAGRFPAVQTDAFFLALTLPLLFIGPVTNAVSSTLIPVLAECRVRRPDAVGPLVGSALGYGTVCSAAATGVLAVAARMASDLNLHWIPRESIAVVVTNVFLLLPLVVLQTATAILDATSNAAGCFWLPAGAVLLRQLATLSAVVVLQPLLRVSTLPLAFTLGALFHLAFLALFWRATATPIRVEWQLRPDLRTALRLAGPLLFATLALQVGVLVTRTLAARLPPGSVTALEYASRITNGILELTSSGVLLVTLADWSLLAARGQTSAIGDRLRRTITLVLFVLLPAIAVLFALRVSVVGLWLAIAHVDGAFIRLIGAVLGFYLIGLPLDILGRIYVRAFLAWQQTSILAALAFARLVLTIVLSLLLVRHFAAPGLAFADTLALGASFAALAYLARRQLGASLSGMTHVLGKMGVAAAISWLVAESIVVHFSQLPTLPLVCVASFTALAAYICASRLMKSEELSAVRSLLRR